MYQQYWMDMAQWRPEPFAMYGMLAATTITTAIMVRIVDSTPLIVGAVGFSVMYFSAYLANFFGRDTIIANVDALQHGIIFAFCGQIFGALILLALFKAKEGAKKLF